MTPNTHTEVPAEAVEIVAREDYMSCRSEPEQARWERLPERQRKEFRRAARRHLSLALPSLHSAWEREQRERLENLAGEYERLGAMASAPAHTAIWNNAADQLRSSLFTDTPKGDQ